MGRSQYSWWFEYFGGLQWNQISRETAETSFSFGYIQMSQLLNKNIKWTKREDLWLGKKRKFGSIKTTATSYKFKITPRVKLNNTFDIFSQVTWQKSDISVASFDSHFECPVVPWIASLAKTTLFDNTLQFRKWISWMCFRSSVSIASTKAEAEVWPHAEGTGELLEKRGKK